MSTKGTNLDEHEPYIETISGKKFHFLNPVDEEIDIVDIAIALANECRFSGHCRFYSVAEHSVLVSSMCSDDHRLRGLMHDASEAYLRDIASPIKAVLGGKYKEIENGIMTVIAKKFDFSWPLSTVVKNADRRALLIEAKQLMVSKGEDWHEMKENTDILPDLPLRHLAPQQAAVFFLGVFHKLTNNKYRPVPLILPEEKRIITNA